MDDTAKQLGSALISITIGPSALSGGSDHVDHDDEMERKSQPTADDPATKAEVRYRQAEDDYDRCGNCTHYSKRHSCDIVAGRINPFDVCDWFEEASRTTAGNPYRGDTRRNNADGADK